MPPPKLGVTLVAFSCCEFISAKCAYTLCSKFGFLYEFVFMNNFINSLSPIFFHKFNITNSFARINLRIRKSSKKFVRIRTTSFWFEFISAKCAYTLCSKFGFLYEFVFMNNFINSLSPIFFHKFNITNSFARINLRIRKSSKKFVRIRTTSFWFVFVKSVLCYKRPVLYL